MALGLHAMKALVPSSLDDRVFGLDLLRAIAIANVMHLHGYAFVETSVPLALYSLPVVADGVALFFVLSGFLIGGIVLRLYDQPCFDLRTVVGFWCRRWFRTLPNYYLALATVAAVSGLTWPQLKPLLLRFTLFVQSFASPHPNFFNEAWSLAVEEWFYFLLPLTALACRPLAPRRAALLGVILTGIGLAIAFRCWRWYLYGPIRPSEWDLLFRRQVVTQLDSLMFGVLAAWWQRHYPISWTAFARPALVVALAGFAVLTAAAHFSSDQLCGFFRQVLYFPTVAGLALLTLPFLSSFRVADGWLVRGVTAISILSYAMYLVNFSIIRNWALPKWAEHWPAAGHGPIGLALFWSLTLGVSVVVYRLYEAPFTRLRECFGPGVNAMKE